MKYKQTKLITYTDKTITDDSWNEEDECVYNAYNFLMYALNKRLERKNQKAVEKANHPFIDTEDTNHESLLKYFAILINDTFEKVETDKTKWKLSYIKQDVNEDYIHNFLSQTNTVIYELNGKAPVLTEKAIKHAEAISKAKKEQEEKERMLKKAKELAKAELLREQEELEELRLEEEAEAQKQAEAEDVDIVIPFRNYGK